MNAASKKSVKPRTKKTTRTYKNKPTKGGLVTSQFQEVVLSPTSTSVSSTMERLSSLQVSPTTTPLSSSTRELPL